MTTHEATTGRKAQQDGQTDRIGCGLAWRSRVMWWWRANRVSCAAIPQANVALVVWTWSIGVLCCLCSFKPFLTLLYRS